MAIFCYDSAILNTYPFLRAAVVHARDVHANFPEPAFQAAYQQAQRQTQERLAGVALSEIPSIDAWRRVFRSFGVKPTQYRSAAEALLRRLQKHGSIPSIHPLVDLANWASTRFALPIAAFDLHSIQIPLRVCFAKGEEQFAALHQQDSETPEPGEVIFVDQEQVVHARRWCWRQSQASASNPKTTEVLFTIEGHHSNAAEDVQSARDMLLELLQGYFEGVFESGTLDPDHPEYSI